MTATAFQKFSLIVKYCPFTATFDACSLSLKVISGKRFHIYGGIFLPQDSQITITIIYKVIAIILSFLETFSR